MTTGTTNQGGTMQRRLRKPWGAVGRRIPEDATTVAQWSEAIGLGWDAEMRPVQYTVNGPAVRNYEGQNVLVRSDTQTPLSIVSDLYKPVQPREMLEFFDHYVNELGAFKMEVAGVMRGGRRVWALAKSTDKFSVLSEDVISRYLLFSTSYDRTSQTIVAQTSFRLNCSNMLTAYQRKIPGMVAVGGEAKATVSVRHSTVFDLDNVREKMVLDEQWENFCESTKILAARKIKRNVDAVVGQFFRNVLYPNHEADKSKTTETTIVKNVAKMVQVFNTAPGQKTAAAKNTAWGLVNAVTYYADHQAGARTEERRLENAWFGRTSVLKERAFERALAFASN